MTFFSQMVFHGAHFLWAAYWPSCFAVVPWVFSLAADDALDCFSVPLAVAEGESVGQDGGCPEGGEGEGEG